MVYLTDCNEGKSNNYFLGHVVVEVQNEALSFHPTDQTVFV
jgi:hypothetical protein